MLKVTRNDNVGHPFGVVEADCVEITCRGTGKGPYSRTFMKGMGLYTVISLPSFKKQYNSHEFLLHGAAHTFSEGLHWTFKVYY
jgi:hypothetical protein